jgi:hypothetical protein
MAKRSGAVWGKPGYRLKKQNFHQIDFRNQSASLPKTLQYFENRDFQSDIFLKISSLLQLSLIALRSSSLAIPN